MIAQYAKEHNLSPAPVEKTESTKTDLLIQLETANQELKTQVRGQLAYVQEKLKHVKEDKKLLKVEVEKFRMESLSFQNHLSTAQEDLKLIPFYI